MSYALLPPEINSGLVYAGPGSASLTAAAGAWQGLATELTSSAEGISSVSANLGGQWQGPSYTTFVNAASPYVTWMHTTAGLATQMGAHATTAATLYETVHAAVIPPPVITANRVQLLTLIATNWLGQNAPAIAANEAAYHTMWATDAAAMDSYQLASQTNNAALQDPPAAPKTSNGPSQARSLAAQPANGDPTSTTPAPGSTAIPPDMITQLNSALGLKLPADATWAQFMSAVAAQGKPPNLSWIQYLSYGAMPMRYLMMLPQLARMGSMGAMTGSALAGAQQGAAGGASTLMTQIGDFVNDKLQGAVGTLAGHFSSATNAISAKLGQAASMGSLKVPAAWSAAADGMVRAAPVLPNTTVSAPVQTMSATSGMPGGPFGNALLGAMAGRGMGAVAAKAPKVMPRTPAGG